MHANACTAAAGPKRLTARRECRSLAGVRVSSAFVVRRAPAPAAIAAALAACGPTPEALVREVEATLAARAWSSLAAFIDPHYGDPLGDRDTLLDDLRAMDQDFPRWTIDWTASGLFPEMSALVASVDTRLDAELVGRPVWKVEGPMRLSLHRTDRWRIRGGLLADLRDIRGLMRARRRALESNDAVALSALLHPNYRDGIIDRQMATERMKRDIEGMAIRFTATNYRLEIREDLAHIDEHYSMSVAGGPARRAVAGLTLRKSAGRWRIAAGLYASP